MLLCVLICFVYACGVCQVYCDDVWRVLGCVLLLTLCVAICLWFVYDVLCDVCVVCVARVCVCACGG